VTTLAHAVVKWAMRLAAASAAITTPMST
jgi:hypothetical protein